MILNDTQIISLRGILDPFVDHQVREADGQKVISYGLSSFGYDIRLAGEFYIFTNVFNAVIDPKNFPPEAMIRLDVGPHQAITIPPNSYVLARSLEYFKMPDNVTAIVLGKSTYARSAVIVNCTPAEAGWCGHLTIEISNASTLPVRVYAHEGIAQVLFFKGEKPTITYASREGKYQDQRGVTFAKL